jgi:uncharacterized YigZ family protein
MPAGRHDTELVIDRSRFRCAIAPAPSIEEAQAFIRTLQKEAPDATHHCWAYLVGPPGSTDRIGLSDDGEPHGTAGRPMFTVLQHSGVGDCVAVVTRYYGGIKLGTGGLVKAYSAAVQQTLETLPRTLKVARVQMVAHLGYGALTAVRLLLPTYEAELLAEWFTDMVTLTLRCPEEQGEPLQQALRDLTRGQVTFADVPPQSPQSGSAPVD